MDKSRPQFSIQKRQRYGDKLVWRYPGTNDEIARQLRRALRTDDLPSAISIGFYRELDDPAGAIAFMPINTPQAHAALGIDMVQIRICEDLQLRVKVQDG